MAVSYTLAASAVASALGAAAYAYVATKLWNKGVTREGLVAVRGFALYWAGVAGYLTLAAAIHLLAAFDIISFPFAVAVRFAGLASACLGLVGLVHYIIYLRAGTARWLRPLVVLYFAAFVVACYLIWDAEPYAVALTDWSVDLAYRGDLRGALFLPVAVLLYAVPIVAAAWYATLARTVDDPLQKRRIVAIGLGVAIQLLSFFLARAFASEAIQLVARLVIGLVVATLVVWAYAGSASAPERERRASSSSG